jgi:hypothetical protein
MKKSKTSRSHHLPHVAPDNACLQSARRSAGGSRPLAQGLERQKFELADPVALPVDEGLQATGIDLELRSRLLVFTLAKARELLKPVHRCHQSSRRVGGNQSADCRVRVRGANIGGKLEI